MKYTDLSSLFQESNSDKVGYHNYGFIYDFIFNTQYLRKGANLDILEIGITYHGMDSSSHVFCSLPIVDSVTGVDSECILDTFNESDKFNFLHADAYCLETIKRFQNWETKYDIIIDDGSHQPDHQDYFLQNYFSLLASGGVLLCEDVKDYALKSYAKKWVEDYNCQIIQLGYNMPDRDDENIVLRYNNVIQ